ncbi:MAG: hypothetical protein ACRDWW_08140 [Acidimicrobiales bacterium]
MGRASRPWAPDDSDGDARDRPLSMGARARDWIGARFGPRRDAGEASQTPDDDLKPSAMRGSESLYACVAAAELIVVAVLNLVITHGKGAPSHPQTTLAIIGLLGALAFVPTILTRSRMIVPFAAVVAAFLVTLPKVPTSLSTAHFITLIIVVIYALVLTGRQRKATAKAGGRGSTARQAGERAGTRAVRGRGGRSKDVAPSGPRASRRYTPPKVKAKRQPR